MNTIQKSNPWSPGAVRLGPVPLVSLAQTPQPDAAQEEEPKGIPWDAIVMGVVILGVMVAGLSTFRVFDD